MGFPTSHEIEEMVEKSWGQGKDPNSRNYSPNLQARMVGHDHELSGDYKSKDQWISEVEGTISGLIDVDKGTAFEVVQVIGGGDSPWACIEMKGTGKSKLGKKWSHEFAYIVKFNSEGMITKLRAYSDSHHLQGHLDQDKAAGANGSQK